ncbi:hypothetical protein DRV85_16095 [Rhodosalinus halophilus]|uniref:Sulfotransferase family protein n=1 Tax=Rhodosalinus halophilus TaxID=2259333 RepID=A0A365U5C5_9RHOB|nr:sulfotransferase [Rhodosalinus halophilus]RBI83333.1 hypothetical protein DRV85_16095 [Rhodosalinus halophilus]
MIDACPPIFVGGTGRSGTTIMGKYLNSHQSVVTPVHENKLIVEDGGLRSLIDNLSAGYEYKSNHNAIRNFIEWANTLRSYGFRNTPVNLAYRAANRAIMKVTGKRIPPAKAARALPFLAFSLVGNGERYGLDHYDRCLSDFLGKVIGATDTHGIVDTEGLLKPVYSPSTTDRAKLLDWARQFLTALNAKALEAAGAARWCDDSPLNARYAAFLHEMYPSAKLVHMVRDPRDVAASYMGKSWASRDLELTLDRLRGHYAELASVEARLPDSFFRTVRLEGFTSDFENRSGELCRFLGIDPEGFDGSVSFEASSFGRWKETFSERERALVEHYLQPACERYGYSSRRPATFGPVAAGSGRASARPSPDCSGAGVVSAATSRRASRQSEQPAAAGHLRP